MNLEFLAGGSRAYPMVRLCAFTDDIPLLLDQFAALGSGKRKYVVLDEMPGVQSVKGCRLILRLGRTDQGITLMTPPADFECTLSAEGWDNVFGRAEMFVEADGGYQWLTTTGDAYWLLSVDGTWLDEE